MTTASFHQAEGIRLLLVEDDAEDAEIIAATFAEAERPRFAITHVQTLAAALDALAQGDFDVVMLDLGLPDSQGLATLAQVRAACDCAVIVQSGVEFEEMALAALNRGAEDYLAKGVFKRQRLVRAVRYAMERRRSLNELDESRHRRQRSRATQRLRLLSDRLGDVRWPGAAGRDLAVSEAAAFEEHTERYAGLIELGVSAEPGDDALRDEVDRALVEMVGKLLDLGAVPRDFLELHGRASRRVVQGKTPLLAQAHLSHGRGLLVTLMAEVADQCRRRATEKAS